MSRRSTSAGGLMSLYHSLLPFMGKALDSHCELTTANYHAQLKIPNDAIASQ